MESVLTSINYRIEVLDNIIRKEKTALNHAPSGRLRISRSRNRTQYYQVCENDAIWGTYLGKSQKKLIQALAQKGFDQGTLKAASEEKKMLEQMKSLWRDVSPEKFYDEYPEWRKALVTPLIPTDEMLVRQWLETPYEKRKFGADEVELYSSQGERVRSKSEMLIANRLRERNIPYKYEYKLVLPNQKVYHPDFTILNVRLRKIIYYEHFGKMDDAGYVNRNLKRLQDFRNNGIILGDNLFLTFETELSPFNLKDLDILIDRWFT